MALSSAARLAASRRRACWRSAVLAGLSPPPAVPVVVAGPAAPPSALWLAALASPLRSEAAVAAAHDAARAPHRPGGLAAPRPRWDEQTPPLGGWQSLG